MVERLHIGGNNAKHVQAFLEYDAIVGNDDGGRMMSEAQFEEYKASVRQKRANRLYVHWRNMETGADCKAIGPASQCFCGARYKEHNFDNVETKKVNAKDPRNKCKLFNYIPVFGSQDFKCQCKHSCHEHNPVTRKCTRPGCKCAVFSSNHSCSCGMSYQVHETVFETRQEREAEGRQVDAPWLQESNMVGGMGGLGHQDFSSLADDQDKRDMMNPNAIMGNMMNQGQIMGEGMARQAIAAENEAGGNARGQRAIAGGRGGGQLAVTGGRGGGRVVGGGDGGAGSQALVPTSGGQPSLLDLFNTPHGYGGGASSSSGVSGVTRQMGRLKM